MVRRFPPFAAVAEVDFLLLTLAHLALAAAAIRALPAAEMRPRKPRREEARVFPFTDSSAAIASLRRSRSMRSSVNTLSMFIGGL